MYSRIMIWLFGVWSLEFTDDKFRKTMSGYDDPAFWPDLANYLIACRKKRQEGLGAIASPINIT